MSAPLPDLREMTIHLGRDIGAQRARELALSLGLKGMEAVDAMLLAVKSQNPALIEWVYRGIRGGPLGEGAPESAASEALSCGFFEALKSKPDAFEALLRLCAREPGALAGAREALLDHFGFGRSLIALAMEEALLRGVAAPGKASRASNPESQAQQAEAICEAFWDALSPQEADRIGDEELHELSLAVEIASYASRKGVMEAALALSQRRVEQARISLSARPASASKSPKTL